MSQENIDLARRNNAAFKRGDWEAVAASLDPHVLIRLDPRWPEQRIYGRAAVVEFFRSAIETLGPNSSIEEITDLGDRLLIRVRYATRGQHSGIETDLTWSEVVTYRDGHTVFAEYFLDHQDALKALGLGEQAMSEGSATPDQVELVRNLVRALDRCDVDTVVSFHAPDAVLAAVVGRFEGVAAIRGFIEDWLANYEEFAATLEEVRDLGNGVTFSVIRQQGRLVGSSGHVQLCNAMVNVCVDGAIARTITGPDIDEARAAAERLAEERG
jgi:ketosteroid isomerase-like protein